MGDGAVTQEIHAGAEDEIAIHFFPEVMALIAGEPHVSARAGDGVGLVGGIISGVAGALRRADIRVAVKVAEILLRMAGGDRAAMREDMAMDFNSDAAGFIWGGYQNWWQ